jgi:hypothetical protein
MGSVGCRVRLTRKRGNGEKRVMVKRSGCFLISCVLVLGDAAPFLDDLSATLCNNMYCSGDDVWTVA